EPDGLSVRARHFTPRGTTSRATPATNPTPKPEAKLMMACTCSLGRGCRAARCGGAWGAVPHGGAGIVRIIVGEPLTEPPDMPHTKRFSMIREFHLADWFTLANAVCGVGALFSAMT